MRTLNVKRTVVVLVVLIVLAGSAHLLHSYQLQRNSSSFKTQAKAAWNGKPRRNLDALKLMNAYLVLEPHDFEAREELGSWYFDSGRLRDASAILEELVRELEEQAPPDLATIQRVRHKLIDAAVAQGRCSDAVTHLEILKKQLPGDVDVLNVLGRCQVALGREDDAIKSYTAAIKLKPERFDISYRKAQTLRFPPKQNLAEAEKCMAEMIAVPANAQSAEAHYNYGLWLMELEKYSEALKQAETTLALQKDHPGGLFLAGQAEMELRHFPQAEGYVRRGMQAAPQDFAMYTLMADILLRKKQRDKAIEVLRNGVETCQSKGAKAQILWDLANVYLDSRRSLDAQGIANGVDCMRKLRDYHFAPERLAFLEARVSYADDDWKTAIEGFEKVRPRLNEPPQLMKCLDYWIGDCYLQQGNPDQAMAAFRRSLSFEKFYFKAHDGIAQIFVANGKLKDAVEEYRQAVISNPNDAEAWQAFARTLVLWNLRRSPDEQNWEDVDLVLQRTQALNPRDGQVQLLVAETLIARDQANQAGDLLKRLRDNSPKGVEYWTAQANLAARQGEMEQAKQILAEARAKLGDQVSIRLAQAPIVLRQQGLQAGAEIERLAANVEAFSVEEKTRLWNGLLNNLLEIKEYDRAKQLCRQIARLQPHDARIRYRLFEVALLTHNARDPAASLAELDRLLDEIDGIAGRGPLWLYGKAVRLKLEAEQGKPELLDAAMDYAAQAQRMRLSWSRPYVLQGEICRQRGRDEEAIDHYLQASINGDRDPEFLRVLLQMLFQRQRYQEAEQVIHRLDSNQTTLTPELKEKEDEILTISGEFHRALESAIAAYDPASDDCRDHIWHGQVMKLLARRAQQEGHRDKLPEIAERGEKALRRACQIAPNSPDCRVALVQFLVATNQMERARIARSDAEEMIPLDASPLAMGYIHEALGESQEAGQSYEKAVRLKPDLPLAIRLLAEFYVRKLELQRAAPLIQRLLSGDVQASESDLVAARRMQAVILASQGYAKLKEATELVDRNLHSPLASPQDIRLKVQLLLADPRQARGPEVLELAERLVMTGKTEPEPEDRFQAARLFLARGDWERCREQMQKLVNGQGDPRYLTAFIRMLLDRDQLSDAELRLDRLERISPSATSVAFRAELMFRAKNWARVPGFLAAYVGQEQAEPKDPLDRGLLVARLLERFGSQLTAATQREMARSYFEQAREWFESYVQKRPGQEMLLAGFDARHGKVEEAIRRIDRDGPQSTPQEVAQVVTMIVARPETTPAQLKTLESAVVALLGKMQRPTRLLVGLAEIQSALDRPQDAEKIYREVLRKDPGNDLAGNNLSFVLAQQKTKLDEALDLIDKTLARAGPLGPFLDTRAVVLITRREPRRALEDLDLALAEKTSPQLLFHKAWACQADGNSAKAKECLQLARKAGLEDSMLSGPEREIRRQIDKDSN